MSGASMRMAPVIAGFVASAALLATLASACQGVEEAPPVLTSTAAATTARTATQVAARTPQATATRAPTKTPQATATAVPPTPTPRPPTATPTATPIPSARIAFTSDRDGNGEIYVMNADGSSQRRLTRNDRAVDYEPVWSPDGRKIAFVRLHDRNYELHVMNADASDERRLTWNPGFDGDPSWSPDGTRIAYVGKAGSTHDGLYVMNADGSGQTRLTLFGGASGPVWRPTG